MRKIWWRNRLWPQGPIPKEWKIGVKRDNGSFDRLHGFDYREAIPVDFSVMWVARRGFTA